MNEIIKSLHARKSVRAYEDKPISQADKEAIILAATQAPSAGNQQLYTVLDITDQGIKDRLAVTCDNQPFIAKAPMVLIFLADFQKWYDVFLEGGANPREPGAGDFVLAVEDSAIAAQNAVVAAESLGIGSCYIGDVMERCEEHRALLELPAYVFPAVMLVFGYPTEQQKTRRKPERCEMRHIVHENRYRRMGGDELREMFQKECKAKTFEEWSRAFCSRKYNSDFSREMTRSVAEYLKAFGCGGSV
jgi:FMN reductase (NADPH)